MKIYAITIYDTFFNQNLTGEFEAESLEAAKTEALEFYACELGTEPNELEIVSAMELL